jgi:hypothetical protein
MIIPGTINSNLPQPPAMPGVAPTSAVVAPAATPNKASESPRCGSRWIARVPAPALPERR